MLEKTVNILEESCETGSEITKDSALTDDLGLNSLDAITIVAEFENEFDPLKILRCGLYIG